jgi:hypothetical protein
MGEMDWKDPKDVLLRTAAKELTGWKRRVFIGEVTVQLCDGNSRRSERRFGWGRETAEKGMKERELGVLDATEGSRGGRPRTEEKNRQLAADIREIVEPNTQADPELKSTRQYTNMTGAEVRQALMEQKGYSETELPTERTFRAMLNRMNYRLKRIQKAKPLKKTEATDAIFENVHAVRAEARSDPETLEISMDSKAKVELGEFSRGGKKPDRLPGRRAQGVGPRCASKRKTRSGWAAGHDHNLLNGHLRHARDQ